MADFKAKNGQGPGRPNTFVPSHLVHVAITCCLRKRLEKAQDSALTNEERICANSTIWKNFQNEPAPCPGANSVHWRSAPDWRPHCQERRVPRRPRALMSTSKRPMVPAMRSL